MCNDNSIANRKLFLCILHKIVHMFWHVRLMINYEQKKITVH